MPPIGNLGSSPVPLQSLSSVKAATTFAEFEAPCDGKATVGINLSTTSALALYGTPSGGAALNMGLLNGGSDLTAGNFLTQDFPINKGNKYGFQVATAQTGAVVISVTARLD